jgi:methyl-accepting chemotaxis protein
MKMAKKVILVSCLCIAFSILPGSKSFGQAAAIIEAVKAATKKVIRAIDLQIQRLQNGVIDLQNIQKGIENKLSKLKLDEISEWTKKQKEIYQQYFDELWRVKSAIAYYKRITEIISQQKQLITEYKQAYTLFQQDRHFTPDEISYMYSVYTGIINESLKNLDQLILIVQSFAVQMSDADRLELINRSANEIENQISDLRSFTNSNIQLSLRRARDLNDLSVIKQLYGLQ